VSGEVGASYDDTAILGFNINQESGETAVGTTGPAGTGVYVDVTNTGGSTLRVQVQGPTGASNPDDRWCNAITTDGGQSFTWGSFNTECWVGGNGAAYDSEPLTAVMIQVPGTPDGVTSYSFCLNDIHPIE
jgi:hypothetical protein